MPSDVLANVHASSRDLHMSIDNYTVALSFRQIASSEGLPLDMGAGRAPVTSSAGQHGQGQPDRRRSKPVHGIHWLKPRRALRAFRFGQGFRIPEALRYSA